MKTPDFNGITRSCLEMTARLTGKYRSRLTGSADCSASAMELYTEMKRFCTTAEVQRFAVRPGQFYGYTKFIPAAYFLGTAMMFLTGPWLLVPIVGVAVGIAMMVSQFALYRHFFDIFYPREEGVNVIGTVEPLKEARCQVIISGHHDSAPATKLLYGKMQRVLGITITAPYLFFLFQMAILTVSLVTGSPVSWWQRWTIFAGLPFVAFYFIAVDTGLGTPGAGDNMIASVITLLLGRELAGSPAKGRGKLRHTRVILISFDAEEAGLRGAAAYFREHGPDLLRLPTYHLNLDSLYNLKELQVLESEINGFLKLSGTVRTAVMEVAEDLGIPIRPFSMVFSGGATDAAESARAGIPSTSIIALPTSVVREGMVYHTPLDTVDHIEPGVVTACLKILWEYLKRIDRG